MRRLRVRPRLSRITLEERLTPATFTVLNTSDSGAGSLRQAVLDANALAGADSIVFDTTAFAGPQTIKLTTGQITLADAVTLTGPTAKLTIDGNAAGRIFLVDVPGKTGQAIAISGMTLTNGSVATDFGAGIYNAESLTLTNVVITNCTAKGGGGVFSGSTSVVSQS